MQKGIIGKKIGMTQIFDEHGKVVPVTVIEAGPCVISQKKTVENDGYAAVQMGYGDMKAHKVNKPMQGHFAKGDVAPKKVLREFRLENTDAYNVGDLVKVDVFAAGDKVDVCGTSKGKGALCRTEKQCACAMLAALSAGICTGSRKPTVPARLPAMLVPTAHVPIRPECSRASICPATSVRRRSPSRT